MTKKYAFKYHWLSFAFVFLEVSMLANAEQTAVILQSVECMYAQACIE